MTKGDIFLNLHQKGNPVILANVWDSGTAKMLYSMGAKAVATSSAAHAFTLGRPDMGRVDRNEALHHAVEIAAAVPVPVSADFENGYGDAPGVVADTVKLAYDAGLAGCSIEDTALPDTAPYSFDQAIERIAAAVEMKRHLPNTFVLSARADGMMNGHYDLDEAIKRLQAFEAAGADCLYAPAPKTIEEQKLIIDSVNKPVNVLVAGAMAKYSYDEFASIGAARLSFGSALARITHHAIIDTGQRIFGKGDFSNLLDAAKSEDVDKMLGES